MRSNTQDVLDGQSHQSARLIMGAAVLEGLLAKGTFTVECRDKDGNLKWTDTIKNTVMTLGKNLALDTLLAGSAYSVTGPFMGLISSASYTTGPSAADTMASHGGWTEAGGAHAPTYSGTRKTCVFAAAGSGSKALSSALNFTFTGNGTVKGCFIALGTGAVNTIDDTNGTLLSAGLFTGGDRAVLTSDQLNVSYSLAI